jgi:hypothetical protein
VKTILVILTTLLSLAAAAQEHGSAWRKEYENEKNGPHGECRGDWERVANGYEIREIRCLGDEDDLDLYVVRIDPEKWTLDTAVAGGDTARGIARQKGARFVINTNFFDAARKPLGAIVRSGEQVRAPRATSWQSIFLIRKDGGARIILPDQWSSYKARTWMAVQAGPRLVKGGRTVRVSQSYAAARAGVCIQKDGALTFFATPQSRKFDMYEISRIARRGEIDGGLECGEAMLFDGGHSVNFFVDGDERVSIEGDQVPVFIYGTKK